MKIAYVAEWDFSHPTGVSKKILSQVRIWNQLGADAQLHVISSHQPLQPSKTILSSNLPGWIKGSPRTYLNKMICAPELANNIAEQKPDIIFYRIGIWYPYLTGLLRSKPSVIELNSLELNELDGAGFIKSRIYPWGRRQILEAAAAFAPVSHEIAAALSPERRPCFVCGNGYDFSSMPPVDRKTMSDRPQALFVSSDGQFWQGVDLILKWAAQLPDLDFHLVGISRSQAPANVIFHGTMYDGELRDLARKMDFGIGTLALHRKGMEEASPLKTREYAAWGLPFVYAYRDTDLTSPHPALLQLPNNENAVLAAVLRVREFALQWRHQPHDSSRFREPLDRMRKEARRLDFFKMVAAQPHEGR
ncbi:MAG: hypothetical protein KF681_13070 [Bdellovibrionaceae bacterium]|nr:hypothetical protein [Pseudobdellovibrionaceae bacterium]